MPFLRGEAPAAWRDCVISEYDYSITQMARILGVEPRAAVLFMVADQRWKLIHAEGFRPLLFDLESDPEEFTDLGESAEHEGVRQMMYDRLFRWARRHAQRTTRSDRQIVGMQGGATRRGILLGVYDGSEVDPELVAKYRPGRL
jgi:hypothetical protein